MEVEPEEFVMVLRFTCGEVDLVQQVDGSADGVAALRNERHTAIIAIALRRRKGCCSHGGVGWLATTVTAIQFDGGSGGGDATTVFDGDPSAVCC